MPFGSLRRVLRGEMVYGRSGRQNDVLDVRAQFVRSLCVFHFLCVSLMGPNEIRCDRFGKFVFNSKCSQRMNRGGWETRRRSLETGSQRLLWPIKILVGTLSIIPHLFGLFNAHTTQ